MSFTIGYEEDLKVIIVNVNSPINLDISKAMVDAEIEMLEKHPGASILYNQGELAGDQMSSDDIFAIAEYAAKLGDLLAGKKMAVVLQDDLSFGLGRMWASFTEAKVPFEIQLFRAFPDAQEWLTTSA